MLHMMHRARWMSAPMATLTAVVMLPGACAAFGLTPMTGPVGGMPAEPWRYAALPDQKFPPTRFSLESRDGRPVLRVETAASYGNLVHRLESAPAGELLWRWRVDEPLVGADLRHRKGDDVALKVCALFDMPREAVPFIERQILRLAESRTREALPNATLCYVWDPSWPADTVIPNVYSRRVRYITLGQSGSGWQSIRRDLRADFLRAFGEESATVPALRAVAVGADADNTGGRSVAYIADLELRHSDSR